MTLPWADALVRPRTASVERGPTPPAAPNGMPGMTRSPIWPPRAGSAIAAPAERAADASKGVDADRNEVPGLDPRAGSSPITAGAMARPVLGSIHRPSGGGATVG